MSFSGALYISPYIGPNIDSVLLAYIINVNNYIWEFMIFRKLLSHVLVMVVMRTHSRKHNSLTLGACTARVVVLKFVCVCLSVCLSIANSFPSVIRTKASWGYLS